MPKKNAAAAAVFLLLAVALVFGQNAQAPTQTMPSFGARFEVVQSSLAARDTFKLDRFRGDVYELMLDHDGTPFWGLTKWLGRPEIGTTASEPRFQLFLGSQRVRDIFLLDLTTGKTWMWAIVGDVSMLTAGANDYAWVPMRDAAVMMPPAPAKK